MKRFLITCLVILSAGAEAATNLVWSDGARLFTIQVGGTNAILAWDDMLESASTAIKQGASDITWNDTLAGESFANTASTNAANDHLTFTYQTSHRRKNGSDLKPHVHFWQTAADQTNMFYIYWAFSGLGETNVAESFSGPASNAFAYTSGTVAQLASFPDIPGAGKGISSILRVKLHRRGAVGTGAVTVTDLDCHYQVDGPGSETPTTKAQ